MNRLDQKFWKNFAAKYWEKKPLAIKDVQSPLREMDAAVVFGLLVKFADLCRARGDSAGFKFYVDGAKLHEDEVLELLPEKSDRTLLGYHERMNEIFEDYGLVCDELLQVNAEKQGRLIEFTRDLYSQVGFPNRFAEMGLYLGNYKKTPFGVHVDGCGVFSFPVAGTKRFRLWRNEYGAKHPDLDRAFEYKKHLKASELMTAKPGDMTYWPSSAWHIAESDGEFSATWSLGVWVDKPHAEVVSEVLGPLVGALLGKNAKLGATPIKNFPAASGEVADLPPLLSQTSKVLGHLDAEELERRLREYWLGHLSAQGLKVAPAAKFRLGKNLKLAQPSSPILWAVEGRTLRCGFAGQVFAAPYSKALVDQLKLLNSGQTVPLKAADRKIFTSLGNAGALAHLK